VEPCTSLALEHQNCKRHSPSTGRCQSTPYIRSSPAPIQRRSHRQSKLTMAPSLLYPPTQLPPASALALSQQAPAVLRSSPATVSSSPLSALFSAPEKPELWIKYENLILSCLRTGDDQAAHQCLERLVARFGNGNERVQALRGLVKEAEAQDDSALEEVLEEYEQILAENDTNIVRWRPSFLPAFIMRPPDLPSVSSLSRNGASRSCGPWDASPTRHPHLCSFSSSHPQMLKRGLSCRISTSPRVCIHRPSTPWRRSCYWLPMHGMYARQTVDPQLKPYR
jgi:hypothetical protein